MRTSLQAEMEKWTDHVLAGTNDLNVIVGPIVWRPNENGDGRIWYFQASTSEAGRGFRCDSAETNNRETCEEMRRAFLLELIGRRPIVIHDMSDVLAAARLCEAPWPGERITKLRQAVEAERRGFITLVTQ